MREGHPIEKYFEIFLYTFMVRVWKKRGKKFVLDTSVRLS